MKVKVISRDRDHAVRQSKHDLPKMQKNSAPELHPFAAQREYKRAVNAVKMERIFAKPFICALDGRRCQEREVERERERERLREREVERERLRG